MALCNFRLNFYYAISQVINLSICKLTVGLHILTSSAATSWAFAPPERLTL